MKKEDMNFELLTPSGETYIKEKIQPWQEYPRPQMKRDNYMILDKAWKLNGQDILVPFPPQATLSGYQGTIGKTLVYEKILLTNL